MIIPVELNVLEEDLVELQTLVFDDCALSKINITISSAMVDSSNFTITKLFAELKKES